MKAHGITVLLVLSLCILIAGVALSGCTSTGTIESDRHESAPDGGLRVLADATGGNDMATIYLAGGCFWGVEKYMSLVNGVSEAEAGYANGVTESPTYRDVTTGETGYTETVRVVYDPEVAPLPFLLDLFYEAIDPTSLNRQGNDVGTQYRSGIYYSDPADAEIVAESLARLQERFDAPIVVESGPLTSYTPAEEYHQDYLDKNPGGYCHISRDLFEKAASAVPE